jgi:hypothetical protein
MIDDGQDNSLILSLGFSPPKSEKRWICAVGGSRLELVGGFGRWEIPRTGIDSVGEYLKRLWIEVEWRRGG